MHRRTHTYTKTFTQTDIRVHIKKQRRTHTYTITYTLLHKLTNTTPYKTKYRVNTYGTALKQYYTVHYRAVQHFTLQYMHAVHLPHIHSVRKDIEALARHSPPWSSPRGRDFMQSLDLEQLLDCVQSLEELLDCMRSLEPGLDCMQSLDLQLSLASRQSLSFM